MPSKHYYSTTCHDLNYACLHYAPSPRFNRSRVEKKEQYLLFHFMCRWTCSRCWKTAMMLGRLGERLRDHNVAVVLIGGGRYTQPATKLAAELKLPFTVLGDEANALRRAYGLRAADTPCPRQALLLLDRDGEIRFRQDQLTSGADLDLTGLLSALDEIPDSILPVDRPVVC